MVAVCDVKFDESIYPRSQWSGETVERYSDALDAGQEFPPIILEPGTCRLWDGWHRLSAHRKSGRESISVVWRECPDGIPAKLFAASFSIKHGDRIKHDDLRQVARETMEVNPDFDLKTMAAMCGVSLKTIGIWVGDIPEKRRLLRQAKAKLLVRGGWTQQRVAAALGISQPQVINDLKVQIVDNEAFWRKAAAGLPDGHGLDTDSLIDAILYAEEEAEAKAEVLEHRPDLAADVENPDIKHPRNYRDARAIWLAQDREEAKRRAQAKREHEESIQREAGRIRSFLSGIDTAWLVATDQHPHGAEVIAALADRDRSRFTKFAKETTWPLTRP
jgi:hypothetical protein